MELVIMSGNEVSTKLFVDPKIMVKDLLEKIKCDFKWNLQGLSCREDGKAHGEPLPTTAVLGDVVSAGAVVRECKPKHPKAPDQRLRLNTPSPGPGAEGEGQDDERTGQVGAGSALYWRKS